MNPQTRPHQDRPTRGFTLIELLVVIGIIGVLVAITIPVISKMQKAARGTATSAQLSALANGIQQYYNDFHAYPGPLPNTQVGAFYYGAGNTPYVPHPQTGAAVPLTTPGGPFPNPAYITGSENLVLGLLGGLELLVNSATGLTQFNYNSAILFPNLTTTYDPTPNPNGPSSLNYVKPHRWSSYVQVRTGEISHPVFAGSNTNGSFVDAAGRMALDTQIPEFLDPYPEGLPILYFRTNHGGTAVVGIGGRETLGGPQLTDNTVAPPAVVTPQYDLAGAVQYTMPNPANSIPGGIGTGNKLNINDHHGLQGLGNPNFGNGITPDTITSQWLSTTPAPGGNGNNACIYFKDPAVTYDPAINPNLSNTHGASARQKDGYLLISPGPDRVYGTIDDIIYPGSLNP